MTGYNCEKAFIDTSPFIYYIEENTDHPQYSDALKCFFEYCYDQDVPLISSAITVEEYCVQPYRNHERERIRLFKRFIDSLGVEVVSIDEVIADKAAQIRAEYKYFKPMDAIQLAAAHLTGCDLFLTNDKQLKQYEEIRVVLVEEL